MVRLCSGAHRLGGEQLLALGLGGGLHGSEGLAAGTDTVRRGRWGVVGRRATGRAWGMKR